MGVNLIVKGEAAISNWMIRVSTGCLYICWCRTGRQHEIALPHMFAHRKVNEETQWLFMQNRKRAPFLICPVPPVATHFSFSFVLCYRIHADHCFDLMLCVLLTWQLIFTSTYLSISSYFLSFALLCSPWAHIKGSRVHVHYSPWWWLLQGQRQFVWKGFMHCCSVAAETVMKWWSESRTEMITQSCTLLSFSFHTTDFCPLMAWQTVQTSCTGCFRLQPSVAPRRNKLLKNEWKIVF